MIFFEKKNRLLMVVIVFLLSAALCFIWGNSLLSKPESKKESLGVMTVVAPVLELFVGEGNVTDHLVRKLAHFTEYTVLGCLVSSLAYLSRREGRILIISLLSGLTVAVIDETIQVYSKRGSQVSDVLLDFVGVLAGTLLVLIISLIKNNGVFNRQRQR